jgi:hypothetical protein
MVEPDLDWLALPVADKWGCTIGMVCSPQGILPCSLKGCNSMILGSGKSQTSKL